MREISRVRSHNPLVVDRFFNGLREINYAVRRHIARKRMEIDNVSLRFAVEESFVSVCLSFVVRGNRSGFEGNALFAPGGC